MTNRKALGTIRVSVVGFFLPMAALVKIEFGSSGWFQTAPQMGGLPYDPGGSYPKLPVIITAQDILSA